MSRAFLILTTRLQRPPDDPSEREAVLAARREEELDARIAAERQGAIAARPVAPPARGTVPALIARIGRTDAWPWRRERHVR